MKFTCTWPSFILPLIAQPAGSDCEALPPLSCLRLPGSQGQAEVAGSEWGAAGVVITACSLFPDTALPLFTPYGILKTKLQVGYRDEHPSPRTQNPSSGSLSSPFSTFPTKVLIPKHTWPAVLLHFPPGVHLRPLQLISSLLWSTLPLLFKIRCSQWLKPPWLAGHSGFSPSVADTDFSDLFWELESWILRFFGCLFSALIHSKRKVARGWIGRKSPHNKEQKREVVAAVSHRAM